MNPQELPLRDLHLPEAVGWWPPAPGWWLLALCLLAALAWYLQRAYRRWRRARPRRIALRELDGIARAYAIDGDVARLGRDLSRLTRRAMLAYAPRDEVAGLTGAAWLGFLDRGLGQPLFSAGPGSSLETLPYRGRAADDEAPEALIGAVRQRLRTPLPGEAS